MRARVVIDLMKGFSNYFTKSAKMIVSMQTILLKYIVMTKPRTKQKQKEEEWKKNQKLMI